MNKWLIFGGGFLTGVIVTFLVLVVIGLSNQKSSPTIPGAKMFEQPTEVVQESSFKVMQAIQENAALVNAKSGSNSFGDMYYMGTLYLLINNEGHYYYDDEIVKVPKGKKVRQVGIYRYETKMGIEKTVPIIEIMD